MNPIIDTIINAIYALVGGPLSKDELEAKLNKLAAAAPEKLEWKHSIVDLLKLIGQDSSLPARERMAAQLGYEGHYNGNPEMNNFLHAEVMKELARRG